MPFLVQIDAYDPVADAVVALRAASVDDPALCHLDGQTWWPVIDRLPTLALDFFGGEFGRVSTPGSSISLSVEPWANFGRYSLPDARLRLWHGDDGASWAGHTLRFDGRVTATTLNDASIAEIGFAVDDKWLDAPLLATYAGTSGFEGPAASKGTAKPLAIGAPLGVPGVMLDPVKSIIQLSAYSAIESVDVPLERLARQFGSPIADYASYAALDAATVPAGQWATAKAAGLVRMGAPPYGKLCFLMKGDKGGPDGWVRRPGAIIKRIAGLAGGASKVSEAAVDALDSARPYDLSVYYGSQLSARDAIQSIAASVNSVAGVTLTGQLIVVPVQVNASGLTLQANGSALPIVSEVKKLGLSAPWWRQAIGAQPFWDVHGQGDYVGDAPPSTAFPTTPPTNLAIGHIYFDATRKQFQFIGADVVSGPSGDMVVSGPSSEQVISSGYIDVQDFGIDFAIDEAHAAQSAAIIAQELAQDAQATADGKVDSFYQTTAPSTASEGDLWFDTDDGNNQYRYTSGVWVDVQDSGIGQAISDAAGAQATADGKVTTFYTESTPTAEALGDLWFRPSTGYLRRWDGFTWAEVSNIGATPAQISSIGLAIIAADNAQATADGKIQSFYQTTMPSGALGDIWFDTDDGNKQYRHNGTTFVVVQDTEIGAALTAAAGAQATADGKVTTFVSETSPTAEGLGDLWFKVSTGELRRWNGTVWGDPLVDLTAAKSPDLTGNFQWDIAGDVLGTVITSLPADRRFKGMEGTIDRSPATAFELSSVSPSLDLAVNNTPSSADRGVVTMGTGTTSGGTAILTATLPGGGVVLRTITVSKTNAIPPSGGGSGSTFAQDTTFNSITGTSHTQMSDELTVRSDGSGNIRVAIDLTYNGVSGGAVRTPSFKASYATTSGGSLTDLFTEEAGSLCQAGTEPIEGYYTRGEATFAMPAPSTDYYFKLQGRRSSGSGSISFAGNSFTVRQ